MANTFTLISSVTVGSGGAANIEFTSIPSTYTDLVLKVSPRVSSTNSTTYIDYNSSTSNQTWRRLYNSSGSVGSDSSSRQLMYSVTSDFTASTFGSTEIYIPNYASSNNKTSSVDTTQENNSVTIGQALIANLWSDTAAINSIRIVPFSGNLVQYSTAYLYGISNA
jgi:hypothetical protein